MAERVPMTTSGAEKLKLELEHLKKVRRPKVIQAIAEARAHGDLRENAEYHAAREEQSYIEGRIVEVESKLAHAQVIDVRQLPVTGKVIFGATVSLVNVNNGSELRYRIVGEDEADVSQGLLSVTSPIARALIGKEEGDVVNVKTPAGEVMYEVVSVEHI